MAKVYRRQSDGFEVQDEKNRSIEWAVETYGGEFVEIFPPILPAPPTAAEVEAIRRDKKQKQSVVLAKLKITEEEFKHLLEGL